MPSTTVTKHPNGSEIHFEEEAHLCDNAQIKIILVPSERLAYYTMRLINP